MRRSCKTASTNISASSSPCAPSTMRPWRSIPTNLRFSPVRFSMADGQDAGHVVSPCQRAGARRVRASADREGPRRICHQDLDGEQRSFSRRRLSETSISRCCIRPSPRRLGDTRHGSQLGAGRAAGRFSARAMTMSWPPPKTSAPQSDRRRAPGFFVWSRCTSPGVPIETSRGATQQYSRRRRRRVPNERRDRCDP